MQVQPNVIINRQDNRDLQCDEWKIQKKSINVLKLRIPFGGGKTNAHSEVGL